ncbi:MAG TPA: response regulator [Vicinamibacterales bacterium]|nr:response regulator [Vicinamibacterales bacterium]
MTDRDLDARLDLETFARTASGLAHALNNVSMAVLGYADMLLVRHDAGEDRADLLEIQRAGRRSALIAQQLRAFGCALPPSASDVDLNEILSSVQRLLHKVLPPDFSVACDVSEPAVVSIDPAQVERALVNLVLNAAEPLVHGTIDLRITQALPEAVPGAVAVQVSVVGAPGVEASADPSTEAGPGSRSAMILAWPYRVLCRNGATLSADHRAESAVFTIAFPAAAAGTMQAPPLVLVVDDEEPVRRLAARMLLAGGFRVVEAASAAAAADMFERHRHEIALALVDLELGDQSGARLIRTLVGERPSLGAILMSGHRASASAAGLAAGTLVLPKPFTANCLLEAVRLTLEACGDLPGVRLPHSRV